MLAELQYNNLLTFTVVKTTAAREPSLRVATQMIVTTTTAPTAVSLTAHCGMSFGETSARVECQRMRLMYSAKIRLITAFEPGFRAMMAVHANRYEMSGPYAYDRYACAPPFNGMADPNSA